MDAYINDMVVKSKNELDYLKDLTEVFEIMREHKLRLNVAKCNFGVSSSKLLGHLVIRQRMEVNPEQIAIINDLVSLRTTKEVQKLT